MAPTDGREAETAMPMTASEAVWEAINLLEADAEATELDEDADRWTEAAAVLRNEVLPNV